MPRAGWVALVVLAAVVPYLPSVDDYFTQDDFGVVQLLANRPWSTFPRWFVMPWMEDIWGYTPDELRPFVAFTYQVTALAGAGRPELHHVFNVAMHAANAVLVMLLAVRGAGLGLPAATLAGVVFAVLPVQAESVAWITGRVDSMPAFFYLATVLAYLRWRQGGGCVWYGLALALFVVALFSKQNTITMVATLALYDVVVSRSGGLRSLAAHARAWAPFAALTLGYLGLRRAVFGASLRGGVASAEQVQEAVAMIGRHLLRTLFGHPGPVAGWEIAAAGVVGVALLVVCWRESTSARRALVFGVLWWVIGAAPVLVAGYESPRHVYLAAVGWAMLVAIAAEGLWSLRGLWRPARLALLVVNMALVGGYVMRLQPVVATWGQWSRVSQIAVAQLAEEASQVPQGTLLLVSVPRTSWDWATPFVLRPPYAPVDLSARVHLLTPFRLHCCGPLQWDVQAREALRRWSVGNAPVVGLHVAESGAVSRVTDVERPELRTLARILMQTDSWSTLDGAVVNLLEQVVRR